MKLWQIVAASMGPIGFLALVFADALREANREERREQADLCRWEDDGGPVVEDER